MKSFLIYSLISVLLYACKCDQTELTGSESNPPFIRAFGLVYSPHIQGDLLTTSNITLSASHKTYDSCYIFESGVNTKSYGNNYLTSFVWDKHDGLIRYTNKNNETYELFKN